MHFANAISRIFQAGWRCCVAWMFLVPLCCHALTEAADAVSPSDKEPAAAVEPRAPVRIGVLANRGYETCMKEWQPMADYLSRRLHPLKFEIVPLGYDEILPTASKFLAETAKRALAGK